MGGKFGWLGKSDCENQQHEFRMNTVKDRKLSEFKQRDHKTKVNFKQVSCSESQDECSFVLSMASGVQSFPLIKSHAKEYVRWD